jgi:putative ABC transport system permease protein
MFAYYLRLAVSSLVRTPGLSALMIGTIGLGIGVFMAALTVYHMMAVNPIPHKSESLFAVRLDGWDPNKPFNESQPEQPPWELTYTDAMALMESDIPTLHAAMHKVSLVVQPDRQGLKPFQEVARLTGGDFFTLFDIPFIFGSPWDGEADRSGRLQVVLSRSMNEQLFGGEDSVNRTLIINDRPFTVVGVTEDWNPSPKFYDVNNGAFDEAEQLFVPIGVGRELELSSAGNTNCWKDEKIETPEQFLASECIWWQFWAQLDTPAQREEYQAFLDGYVAGQKQLGRFQRPMNNALTDVDNWLEVRRVVRDDNKVLVALSLLFLGVCLFNTVGLMLTKFLGKAPQIGVRRALGASRRNVLGQQLMEVGAIGTLGGITGLGMAWLALQGAKSLFPGFEHLGEMDFTMVGIAIACAVVTTIIAGLYPAWRVCRVPPAFYLRLQ